MRQTGHHSLAMVRRYIRDSSLFREKPGRQARAVKAKIGHRSFKKPVA
jgi:hypothetical protein